MDILSHISSILHYAVSFIIIISAIVFIHEFGHFIVARMCGVKIDEFSIGFGREIYGWNDKRGTRWKISILPLGGFVKMHGDESEASTPDVDKLKAMSEEEKSVSFYYKPLWQKTLIVLAGPFFNYLFAFLITAFIFMSFGKLMLDAPPVVNQVVKNGAAEKIGLQSKDVILEVDGKKITKFGEIPEAIKSSKSSTIAIKYKRGEQIIDSKFAPLLTDTKDENGEPIKVSRLGITSEQFELVDKNSKPLGFFESIGEAGKSIFTQSKAMLVNLAQIATGKRSSKELGGPVKIMDYSGQSTTRILNAVTCMFSADGHDCGKQARDGIIITLLFMSMISISLGLLNLFPIPMLDGGHVLFYIIEAVMRRPAPEKVQEWTFRVGFAFLATLILYVTYNDIISFVGKHLSS